MKHCCHIRTLICTCTCHSITSDHPAIAFCTAPGLVCLGMFSLGLEIGCTCRCIFVHTRVYRADGGGIGGCLQGPALSYDQYTVKNVRTTAVLVVPVMCFHYELVFRVRVPGTWYDTVKKKSMHHAFVVLTWYWDSNQ